MYVVSTLIFLMLDGVFLTLASPMFKAQIADVQSSPLRVNMWGGILCYLFLIFGLQYFIISKRRPVLDAFLFGLVVYGVYETTTFALLKNWRIETVLMDTLWGGVLFALTTFLTYKASAFSQKLMK